jgi:lipoyl(octanoyl) transferase
VSARYVRVAGLAGYEAVHALQRQLVDDRIADRIPDTVVFVEHAPVITLGRKRTSAANVVDSHGWPVVEVERGGDVTWHGPGQLVAYPIIRLEGSRADLHRHLHALEDAVIAVCDRLGLRSGRDPRNTGVWLPVPGGARKVASIGIACRKWVTWHGLALNVAPDLDAFAAIRPCGFDASIVTRLADHLDPCPSIDDLVPLLADALAESLAISAPSGVESLSL